MIIRDVMQANEDVFVNIRGKNPNFDVDPFAPCYYSGMLSEIPVEFQECEFLYHAWSLVDKSFTLFVPWMFGERTGGQMGSG